MRGLIAVAICSALLLGGCGGGGDSGSASVPSGITQDTTTTAPQQANQAPAGQGEGKGEKTERSSTVGANKDHDSSQSTSTVKVPPISSAPVAGSKTPAPGVKTVKGGDNSVQTYGVEADEGARTEAATALQAYLNARSEEDWGKACSLLAQRPKQQLAKVASQAKSQGKDLGGYEGVMAALNQGTPQSELREKATIAEVLSFRGEGDIPGDPSYLIFDGPPGSTLYSMPMYLEGGAWKVGLMLASELPV